MHTGDEDFLCVLEMGVDDVDVYWLYDEEPFCLELKLRRMTKDLMRRPFFRGSGTEQEHSDFLYGTRRTKICPALYCPFTKPMDSEQAC